MTASKSGITPPPIKKGYRSPPMEHSKSGITPAPIKKGYRSPPMDHCWKPGQSGNPKGKKKGTKNLATVVRNQARKPVILQDKNGKKRTITDLEAHVETCSQRGLRGNARAQAEILKLYQTFVVEDVAAEQHDVSREDFAILYDQTRLLKLLDDATGDGSGQP